MRCREEKQSNNLLSKPKEKTKLLGTPVLPRCLVGLHILGSEADGTRQLIHRLEAMYFAEYEIGSPRTDLLLGLIQLNYLRALVANIDVLGLKASDMHDDAISPFCISGTWHHAGTQLPPGLSPSILQSTLRHHPWIDLLPSSKFRDNLILAEDTYDDVELCHDMRGYQTSIEKHTGVIVWKDPWDPLGWELTETFYKKWSWALRDCWDLFQSTNTWRMKRGEKLLFPTIGIVEIHDCTASTI
jgi:hypothetical protein